MGSEETWQHWVQHDMNLYPVLESAGLVKTRKK